ncbi:cation acetate symporter [Streptomyces scopuliridis]|uniref:Cation acetate symporter n=1 Tax=Streptomyces scopuliridis TaxID=452529 RepID=A0ACD4ZYP8_9ACTN|nr:cation acetate symporter [Streptomyces scopuliridis]WSC02167.1 cation acetate symporter [Streptomyces scopuliridis]WSC04296.1 cation acetate symporter [Streptomyces scopuliridis]
MSQSYTVTAVTVVVLATVLVGGFGLRISRTTSDFYVASRTVRPALNAAAISGEYLSAASFLGVAGLVLLHGPDMLWYPVGYTAGYLVLLIFVAAPLRRSGAYTLPDFAEGRLESRAVRRLVSVFVVGAGWLYLVPQLQGAGLTLKILTGAPDWFGGVLVALVVVVAVAAGGMRSITFVQAFQYWLKLTALLVPALFLLLAWQGDGRPRVDLDLTAAAVGRADHPLYATYGLIVATFLGTMGLPHVVVRFYTSPNGRAARRTTVIVLALIGAFYLLPPVYGALGRLYVPELPYGTDADAAVLLLPERAIGGLGGDLLGALVAGGAFAAFLSTASGLTMAVAGVLTQDVLPSRGVRHFRLATPLAMAVPLGGSLLVSGMPVADSVGMAFAVSASSFCPLLVLGIWWRRLTPPGAIAGLLLGGGLAFAATVITVSGAVRSGWPHALLAWPAVWSVPVGFLAMILVSLATRGRIPPGTNAAMTRFHLPEVLMSGSRKGSASVSAAGTGEGTGSGTGMGGAG